MFENPFQCPGHWYRANLHCHTTNSDGTLSPADTVALYREAGYQVLALTDHWYVSELASDDADFLVISGVELDGGQGALGYKYHLVGLNLRQRGVIARPNDASAQDLVDFIRGSGGEVIVGHPYWSGLMAPDIANLSGCLAVEVYSSYCDLGIARGLSVTHWDDLLTLGHQLGGVAVDDTHKELGRAMGWTMIRAQELTVAAVMEALRRGRYYGSTGPEISDVRVDEEGIHITTSPVKSITLVCEPQIGVSARGRDGRDITAATFPLLPVRYCRLQVLTREGKMAWTNPVALDAGPRTESTTENTEGAGHK